MLGRRSREGECNILLSCERAGGQCGVLAGVTAAPFCALVAVHCWYIAAMVQCSIWRAASGSDAGAAVC